MSHTSPYGQGGPWSTYSAGGASPAYGALPYVPPVRSPNTVTFQFTPNFNGASAGPLNSTITDSNGSYFIVATGAAPPGFANSTVFTSSSTGVEFARVEWTEPKPFVTIRNRIQRQDASMWIFMSRDRSTANLGIGPKFFQWVFERNSIKLYNRGENSADRVGKLYWSDGCLCLDLDVSLVQGDGSLEVLIVAAALVQSGKL